MREINDALPGANLVRDVIDPFQHDDFPEDRLYDKLAQEYDNDAHLMYNALIRRLVSFERAVDWPNWAAAFRRRVETTIAGA